MAAAAPPGRGGGGGGPGGFRRDGGGGGDQDLAKKTYTAYPNVDEEAVRCHSFLLQFQTRVEGGMEDDEEDEEEDREAAELLGEANTAQNRRRKYLRQLIEIKGRHRTSLDVSLDDVEAWDAQLAQRMARNTLRYQTLLARAADMLLASGQVPEHPRPKDPDSFDIWNRHRELRVGAGAVGFADQANQAQAQAALAGSGIPSELTRRFEVNLIPVGFHSGTKMMRLREIRAAQIGGLVSVRGMVARVSEVRPLVQVVAYVCSECGWESYQTVKDQSFTPIAVCPSQVCVQNQSKGELYQQTRGSKFVRFQEIRLQELPHEVPQGNVPRAITLRVFGELTRKCTPGQIVSVAGISLPARHSGFRAMRAGLTADTYVHVTALEPEKKSMDSNAQRELTPALLQQIEDLRAECEGSEEKLFSRLAQSIAPEIYGMEDVKKALLLLVLGAPTRRMNDGMTIRGDINVLLMGDPGVAKSQLLKHISKIAPRAVYTTGKGSSGVGLTAAVLRDPVSGEMALEGGALVLADMGICCIDEFDKMEEGDRTAIHEVMEQQTVSIAKAGITTTLNARTSILAAANPVWGRWNRRASAEKNIGLPTALLSRFDLTFVLLDTADEQRDEDLARHITQVHRTNEHPPLGFEPCSPELLRAYISRARQHEPYVPQELAENLISSYIELRQHGMDGGAAAANGKRTQFCTARTLLSLLRLSQALARLHLRDKVIEADFHEAMRLVNEARDSANSGPRGAMQRAVERAEDHSHTQVMNQLRLMTEGDGAASSSSSGRSKKAGASVVRRADLVRTLTLKGVDSAAVDAALERYAQLGVLSLSRDGAEIRIL